MKVPAQLEQKNNDNNNNEAGSIFQGGSCSSLGMGTLGSKDLLGM